MPHWPTGQDVSFDCTCTWRALRVTVVQVQLGSICGCLPYQGTPVSFYAQLLCSLFSGPRLRQACQLCLFQPVGTINVDSRTPWSFGWRADVVVPILETSTFTRVMLIAARCLALAGKYHLSDQYQYDKKMDPSRLEPLENACVVP